MKLTWKTECKTWEASKLNILHNFDLNIQDYIQNLGLTSKSLGGANKNLYLLWKKHATF